MKEKRRINSDKKNFQTITLQIQKTKRPSNFPKRPFNFFFRRFNFPERRLGNRLSCLHSVMGMMAIYRTVYQLNRQSKISNI